MEEIPEARGTVVGGQVRVGDAAMVRELQARGFGEAEGGALLLRPFEALYLLYSGRLSLRGRGRRVGFDSLMGSCLRDDPDILTKFLIYRDLRVRGYVARDGFGFGSDFVVYDRGHFGQKAARFLVFGLSEGGRERMGPMQKKIDEIIRMGKEPIVAVVERRGEVIYYRMNRVRFGPNPHG